MPDKYLATWVSHSSISDFLKCPRSYYLKNVYRDPKTNRKIKIMSPSLALGQAVHEVLESLSTIERSTRFSESLIARFDRAWDKVKGKRGGFFDQDSEYRFKMRGQEMLRTVMNNPGPLNGLAVKIQMDLPYYWLSEEENIILCGKIDWLEYLPDTDSVHIIDFKTGKAEEEDGSLQLPIYLLLATKCQKRKVSQASYWYLNSGDKLSIKELPDIETAERAVMAAARQIKLARQVNRFKCKEGEDGCYACRPYEMVLAKQAEHVGNDDYADIYVLQTVETENREGVIL